MEQQGRKITDKKKRQVFDGGQTCNNDVHFFPLSITEAEIVTCFEKNPYLENILGFSPKYFWGEGELESYLTKIPSWLYYLNCSGPINGSTLMGHF